MQMFSKMLAAVAMLGATSLVAVPQASAAPMLPNSAMSGVANNTEAVQYRYGGGYHRGGYGHRGYGHRGYHRGGGYGAGAALGGLAAGAIIGGAIASSQAQARGGGDAVAYCSQRYRSYDPASGTYLNNDGNRYPCP